VIQGIKGVAFVLLMHKNMDDLNLYEAPFYKGLQYADEIGEEWLCAYTWS